MNGPVLYVENDENDIFLFNRALKRIGFSDRFETVMDGQDALAYLQGSGEFADRQRFPMPSLLILDLKMPRVGGLEVLRWVRAQPRFAALAVMLLSSSTHPSDIASARKYGANAYAVKPGTPQQLEAMLHSIRDEVFSAHKQGSTWPVKFNQLSVN